MMAIISYIPGSKPSKAEVHKEYGCRSGRDSDLKANHWNHIIKFAGGKFKQLWFSQN